MGLTPQIDPIDADLNQFEHDIRLLKIEYEQYFGGGKKRPPAEIEWRIELTIKRHGDRGAAMNYSQRFRYSNLQQTYARYKDMFRKRVQRREEGTGERHFGSAARSIAAQRAGQKRESRLPAAVSCIDPESEPEKVDTIYNAFLACRASLGESTEGMSREKFQQFLKRKIDELRRNARGGEVEFVADVEGGKSRLRARLKTTT